MGSASDCHGLSFRSHGWICRASCDAVSCLCGCCPCRCNTNYLTPNSTTTSTDPVCTVTTYSTAAVSAAVSSCTDIHIRNLTIPGGSTLDLSKAKPNTVITFEGRTVSNRKGSVTAGILRAESHHSSGSMPLPTTTSSILEATTSPSKEPHAVYWTEMGLPGGMAWAQTVVVPSEFKKKKKGLAP